MKYALNTARDGRILSAWVVLPNGNYDGMPIVDTIPDGDISDYHCVLDDNLDWKYEYDPIPEPSTVPVAPRNITEGEFITIDGVMYKAITNIPNGASIITGQNAIETTIEAQLYELQKGE